MKKHKENKIKFTDYSSYSLNIESSESSNTAMYIPLNNVKSAKKVVMCGILLNYVDPIYLEAIDNVEKFFQSL